MNDANADFSHAERAGLFAAVRDRDLDALRRCLDSNPALTEARANNGLLQLRGEAFDAALREPLTEHSSTALHLAANSFLDPRDEPPRSVEVVRMLLEYGADADAVGYNGNTGHCAPIVIAAWEGGLEKMRLLLEAGADVSGAQGIRALRTAANHNRIDRFDLLLEYGATASPWMLVRAGLVDRVLALVDEDPGLLTRRDEQGCTLLQAAGLRMNRDAGEGLPEAGRRLAEALIERGAAVDVFTAAALDHPDRLQPILAADSAQVHQRLGDGSAPVDLAVLAGSNDTLRLLLEAGAEAGAEALSRAARMDDAEACRLLIEHGAEVTEQVLLSAAWRNRESACLELILAHGGNPDAVDGRAALHWVAATNPRSVQLLIDAGADVNARAPAATDNTPLHQAAGNADSTRRLLAAGADPTLTNANGDTPLDLAERSGAEDVAELLR